MRRETCLIPVPCDLKPKTCTLHPATPHLIPHIFFVHFAKIITMNFIIRLLVTAAVAYGLAYLLKGIHIDSYWTALVFALVLAIVNLIIRPLLIIFTIPLTIITLGLFLFVINALMVLLAAKVVDGIIIDGFWWALLFGLLLSVVSSLLLSSKNE